MAGTGDHLGNDADPMESYLKIYDVAHTFYFVQGNHDYHNEDALQLRNEDGTYCCLDRRIQQTILGTISGLNGIIARKEPDHNLHIYEERLYMGRLNNILKRQPLVDILVTHQPLRDIHVEVPKLHLCGHWYAPDDEYICNLIRKALCQLFATVVFWK
jgi:hypothetical protein